jgi:hypothetical protein
MCSDLGDELENYFDSRHFRSLDLMAAAMRASGVALLMQNLSCSSTVRRRHVGAASSEVKGACDRFWTEFEARSMRKGELPLPRALVRRES